MWPQSAVTPSDDGCAHPVLPFRSQQNARGARGATEDATVELSGEACALLLNGTELVAPATGPCGDSAIELERRGEF